MKILKLGWEYAPNITGGLGVATQGLAEALADAGHEVTFLLPKKSSEQVSKKVRLIDASILKPDLTLWKKKHEYTQVVREVEIGQYLVAYLPPQTFEIIHEKQQVKDTYEATNESDLLEKVELKEGYEGNLQAELFKYALLAAQVAKKEKFDLVHAHDWLTFKAGFLVKKMTGIPFFAHVHSTEYDRNGQYMQDFVVKEEKAGLEQADHIFCVSQSQRETIVSNYGVATDKISIAPNASLLATTATNSTRAPQTIAFIGRLTHQKSPATFIDIARDLTSRGHDFQYLIIGEGFLQEELEQKVASSNLTNRIRFTGFLNRKELLKKFSEIDLLIAPSVSEPFGLVILEAILKNVPVAAARGAGVGEFIPSLPQVERWDHFSYVSLAEKLMTNKEMRSYTINKCREEAGKLSWKATARKISDLYANYL